MSDETTLIDIEKLREFVPLSLLAEERLKELAVLATVEVIGSGVHLFHEGDVDNQTMYLLQGTVQLISNSEGKEELILSGTPEAAHPIADSQPRQLSAVASSDASVLCIDNNVLDYMLTWDQITTMEKGADRKTSKSNDEENHWMDKMQSLQHFRNIPAANIKQLMDKMEEMEVHKEDVIIRQGEPGDYFYLLDKGTANVTRQVQLADLHEGEGFGEEALISDSSRNATVVMTTEGKILRLSKKDFDELLKEPLLSWVTIEEAKEKVKACHRILRLRSDRAGSGLAKKLRELGAEVDDCILYKNERIRYESLPAFEVVFFASASAVNAFIEQWGPQPLTRKTLLTIGSPTARELEKHGLHPDVIARKSTVAGAISTLAEFTVSCMLTGRKEMT